MMSGNVIRQLVGAAFNRKMGIFTSTTGAVVLSLSWYSKSSVLLANSSSNDSWKTAASVYEFSYVDIDGKKQSMEKYKGNVLVVTNLASKCTLTTVNYEQLTELYNKYEKSGLRIIGFPCNQFANQEPGTEAEIKEFISQFKVKFDMSSKIDVNGEAAHPLWKYLKSKEGGILGGIIKWNFTKFLIDKNGVVVKRYGPTSKPEEMEPEILQLLKQ